MAHAVDGQQHVLHHVLHPILLAMVAGDDGAQERQYLAQQPRIGGLVAVLRRRHPRAPSGTSL
jgi:hypothetical protein